MEISAFRDARLNVSNLELPIDGYHLTAVVGLYNAEAYLEQVLENLRVQTLKTPIIVIDNSSSDKTWTRIQPWLAEFPGRMTLVRNPVNVGGWGSLYLNCDLVETEWFAMLHQDDVYKGLHLETLSTAISTLNPDVVCIATDFESLSPEGLVNVSYPPRAVWGLQDTSRESWFLSNLRLHNLPNPSSAYRRSTFEKYTGPWHSSAFPDTEWLLSALLTDMVKYIPVSTMFYRENPVSDSHTIEQAHGQLGAYLSISRIVNDPRFVEFCRGIDSPMRSKFAQALFTGIGIRVKEDSLRELLVLAAAEQMAFSWNYSEPTSSAEIARAYELRGGGQVSELVESIGSFFNQGLRSKSRPFPVKNAPPKGANSFKGILGKRIVLKLFGVFPLAWKRRLFKWLLGTRLVPESSPWFMNWKNK